MIRHLPLPSCCVALLAGCAAAPATIDIAGAGFATPESVLHDPIADVYLVSNIQGSPFERDDDGFISRVHPDGRVLDLKWIDGGDDDVDLDAPKGMALVGDELWVTDISCVRRFARGSGRPLGVVGIAGSTFLNDIVAAADGDGAVVTDSGFHPGFEPSGTDAIHRIHRDGRVEALVRGAELHQPNGIAAHAGSLYVADWSVGEVVRRNERGGGAAALAKLPAAQLDGLLRTREGDWLVSSWVGQAVYRVGADGAVAVVVDGVEAPADIGYDATRHRLLLPLFLADRVLLRDL